MQLPVDAELRAVCAQIVAADLPVQEWRATEAGDHVQGERYHGGYDAPEDAFCFSYYAPDGRELWLEFTLYEAVEIAAGRQLTVEARNADPLSSACEPARLSPVTVRL
jgi:hypothetical protein